MIKLRQGLIPGDFVAAKMIALVDSAGLDLRQRSGSQSCLAAVNVVVLESQVDRLIVGTNHILQQVAAHPLGKGLQSKTLFRCCPVVHNDYGLYGVGIAAYVAKSAVRAYDTDDGKAIEPHAIKFTLVHSPAKYGQVADQVDL